jgi:hypothetical protein
MFLIVHSVPFHGGVAFVRLFHASIFFLMYSVLFAGVQPSRFFLATSIFRLFPSKFSNRVVVCF